MKITSRMLSGYFQALISNNMIYLDNSATTALCAEARAAMEAAFDNYGNPSSLHKAGLEAHKIMTDSRAQVLKALGVRGVTSGQLVFTASGTEANNTAIFGTVYAKKRRISNRIITTDSEHPAVENSLKRLETDGFEVIRIPTKGGVLDFDAYAEALKTPPILVTLMMVNNETGARYDVGKAFKMAKKANPETVTHCDAVQGFLKCNFTPDSISADLVTVSAHKIHGPKGVGALYIAQSLLKAKKIIPFMCGGEQEFDFRPGTENTVGIAGFGAAAEIGFSKLSHNIEKMASLRDYAIEKMSSLELSLNIPNGERAPHIVNITLPNIKSETMLHFLSSKDICISSGSACSSHSKKTSRALLAFGLSERQADCSLRVSLCETNTIDDIDKLTDALGEGISTLVRFK